jgi:hypothetical protein
MDMNCYEQLLNSNGWAAKFWASSQDPRRLDDQGRIAAYDWAVDQFGPCDHTFSCDFSNQPWSFIIGNSNTLFMFKDVQHAMLFKLTWC